MTTIAGEAGLAQPAGVRPIGELRSSGLLWLINRTVFHPRGYALALVQDEAGAVIGWQLDGDGTEPWAFGGGIDETTLFALAEATLGRR